jgi:hypothetical protein
LLALAVGVPVVATNVAGAAVSSTLATGLVTNQRISLRVTTAGYTDRSLRHQDGAALTAVVNDSSADLLKQDATFTVRAGLADATCYSFESVNFPGQFLRHRNWRVYKDANDNTDLYKKDATFCAQAPRAGGTNNVSLASYNIAGAYLRHYGGVVYIAVSGGSNQWDAAGSFDADTTWNVGAPWVAELTSAKKKGVSTWAFNGLAASMKDVGAGWYYNWSVTNDSMPADAEFVPMIWDETHVNATELAKAKSEGGTLLGFNEPDMSGQAAMSVSQALDLWPQLQNTGMRLGSPAVAYGGDTAGGWLDQFMTGVQQRGLRVDFITLHWYGSDFSDAAVGHFMGYVQAVYNRYKKPIWVTEYGLINFTGSPKYPSTAQITAFITNSTKQMQAASYVERYAWFSLPAVGDSLAYGLYQEGAVPTAAGVAYRAAG